MRATRFAKQQQPMLRHHREEADVAFSASHARQFVKQQFPPYANDEGPVYQPSIAAPWRGTGLTGYAKCLGTVGFAWWHVAVWVTALVLSWVQTGQAIDVMGKPNAAFVPPPPPPSSSPLPPPPSPLPPPNTNPLPPPLPGPPPPSPPPPGPPPSPTPPSPATPSPPMSPGEKASVPKADRYPEGIANSGRFIAIFGSLCTTMGVLMIVVSVLFVPLSEFTLYVSYNAALQVLTTTGLVCSFFVFTEVGQKRHDNIYPTSAAAVFIMTYAQSLIYSTSDAVRIVALPALFFPAFAAAAQMVTWICIQDHTFLCEQPSHHRGYMVGYNDNFADTDIGECSKDQKAVALAAWIITYVGLLLIVLVRLMAVDETMTLQQFPFVRSFVLFYFLCSFVMSVYVLSVVDATHSHISHYFTLLSTFFSFSALSTLIAAGGALQNYDELDKPDEIK